MFAGPCHRGRHWLVYGNCYLKYVFASLQSKCKSHNIILQSNWLGSGFLGFWWRERWFSSGSVPWCSYLCLTSLLWSLWVTEIIYDVARMRPALLNDCVLGRLSHQPLSTKTGQICPSGALHYNLVPLRFPALALKTKCLRPLSSPRADTACYFHPFPSAFALSAVLSRNQRADWQTKSIYTTAAIFVPLSEQIKKRRNAPWFVSI